MDIANGDYGDAILNKLSDFQKQTQIHDRKRISSKFTKIIICFII